MSDIPPIRLGAADAPVPFDAGCACCEGLSFETPARIFNRSGLTTIRRRVGVHASFKRTMLARLSSADNPALNALKTRDDDDLAIALIDAWAAACDVLTFYQEYIANEGYLISAKERLSILELAALIGYRPRPGAASAGHVALFLDEGAGVAPPPAPELHLEAGLRIQHVPGPDEVAQTFETVAPITARADLNRLRPQQSALQIPDFSDGDADTAWFAGVNTGLQPGHAIAFVGPEREGDDDSDQWIFARVADVAPDPAADATRVRWTRDPLSSAKWLGQTPKVFAFRRTARQFGYSAPHKVMLPRTEGGDPPKDLDDASFSSANDWAFRNSPSSRIYLDSEYRELAVGSWAVLQRAAGYSDLFQLSSVRSTSRARYGVSGKAERLDLKGKNFTRYDDSVERGHFRGVAVYCQSEAMAFAETPLATPITGAQIILATPGKGLTPGQVVSVRGRRAQFVTTEAATLVTARSSTMSAAISVPAGVRVTALSLGTHEPSGDPEWRVRLDNGRTGWIRVADPDALRPIAAADDAETIAEIAVVDRLADYAPDRGRLRLAEALTHAYDRASCEILGNVAPITHGESVSEILGGGDPRTPFQAFDLRQGPLTHLRAGLEGAASTLEVRVNDVLWREAPHFFGRGPAERVFTTRTDDDGVVTVLFGDGAAGARPDAGEANIIARYRKGAGVAGDVAADTISNLLDRPLGLAGATNPTPTLDGADPATRDQARTAAPVGVLTLGRAVSMQDYADFARAYVGVAKARADLVWDGARRRIVVTVAGEGGVALAPDGAAMAGLLNAFRAAGDPHVPFVVAAHRPVEAAVALTVAVHPDHPEATVLAAVDAELRAAFGFAARDFGARLALSEIAERAHRAPGVIGVRPTMFKRADKSAPARPRLLAEGARFVAARNAFLGAELLVLGAQLTIAAGATA